MATMPFPAPIAPFARGVAFLLAQDGHDLSARQIGLLLHVAGTPGETVTVRGAAAALRVSKPAITRGTDALAVQGLLRRKPDPNDRRSVFLVLTRSGVAFVNRLSAAVAS